MSTQTQVRPERSDTDDPDRMFHYVDKSKIAESAVMGTLVTALCGERFPVTRTPKPGSPVCPDCERIFKQLPSA